MPQQLKPKHWIPILGLIIGIPAAIYAYRQCKESVHNEHKENVNLLTSKLDSSNACIRKTIELQRLGRHVDNQKMKCFQEDSTYRRKLHDYVFKEDDYAVLKGIDYLIDYYNERPFSDSMYHIAYQNEIKKLQERRKEILN